MTVATSFLVSVCSVPVHAGDIKPDSRKHSSRRQKTKISHHNDAKHKKKTIHKWPGQGDPKVEKVRKCIRHRESRGNYKVVDKGGRWFGAYQFDPNTSNTAAKMMKRPDLVGVPANKWTRKEQDAAFYLIYNRGKGKKHFYCPVKKCF